MDASIRLVAAMQADKDLEQLLELEAAIDLVAQEPEFFTDYRIGEIRQRIRKEIQELIHRNPEFRK